MPLNVLATGASGFVGEALVMHLLVGRRGGGTRLQGLCRAMPFDLTRAEVLPAFKGIKIVVHAPVRVHVMREEAADALAGFRDVNVQGALKLVRQATDSRGRGKRFIFICSIKVNDGSASTGEAFRADDLPSPLDPLRYLQLRNRGGVDAAWARNRYGDRRHPSAAGVRLGRQGQLHEYVGLAAQGYSAALGVCGIGEVWCR